MANQYDLWLNGIPGIGSGKIASIISACGSARECFFLREEGLRYIPRLREEDVQRIIGSRNRSEMEKHWERLMESKAGVVRMGETSYPRRLLTLADPPYLLFYYGRLPAGSHQAVAMVGARECTPYGRDMACRIARSLAQAGIDVISGLARGIDSASHRGALAGGGETYGVLGSGPDICYPESEKTLYDTMIERGGVLSEYPPLTRPERGHFPARNRLISALSDAVLVIEARKRSGSLITADFALEQGKDVYALPGRMTDALSYGTNQLIRQGAEPIVSVEELLKDLQCFLPPREERTAPPEARLAEREKAVLKELDVLPMGMEELLKQTGLSVPELSESLYDLVRQGFAEESFSGMYRRCIGGYGAFGGCGKENCS